MFCEKCGKELKDDWKKCPYCGQMIGGDSVRMEGQPEMLSQVASAPLERNFSDNKLKKKGKLKKILLGIGGVFLILVVIAIITPSGDDSSSSDNKECQEELEEIKTLEEAGGFKQWKEDGFPGKVRANISIDFPLVNTDRNNYAVYIEGGAGVVMQEDEMSVKDWKWLMDAEPDEDTQKAYFNGILKYLGQEDEMPVFLISDVEEGNYSAYAQGTGNYAELDLEELMGQSEKILEDLGFTYDESDIGYSLLGGNVLVMTDLDEKVYMIMLTGSGSDMPNFHGVKIGMKMNDAETLLSDKYTRKGLLDDKVAYIDLESGIGIGLQSKDENVTEIYATLFSEEEIQEYGGMASNHSQKTEEPESMAIEEYINSCEEITGEELARNPEKYIGKNIILEGKFNILANSIVLDWFTDSGIIKINYDGKAVDMQGNIVGNVMSGDYGYVAGRYRGEDEWGKRYIDAEIIILDNGTEEGSEPISEVGDGADNIICTGDFFTDVANGILYGKDGIIVDVNGNVLSEYADYFITEEGYISNGDWVEEGYTIDDAGKIIQFQM